MVSDIERLTRLEYDLRAVAVRVETLEKNLSNIDSKLDQLLALRNKGVGAFWLMSALLGTGIIGAMFTFLTWLRGGGVAL